MGNLVGNSKEPKHHHGAPTLCQVSKILIEEKRANNNIIVHSTALNCNWFNNNLFNMVNITLLKYSCLFNLSWNHIYCIQVE